MDFIPIAPRPGTNEGSGAGATGTIVLAAPSLATCGRETKQKRQTDENPTANKSPTNRKICRKLDPQPSVFWKCRCNVGRDDRKCCKCGMAKPRRHFDDCHNSVDCESSDPRKETTTTHQLMSIGERRRDFWIQAKSLKQQRERQRIKQKGSKKNVRQKQKLPTIWEILHSEVMKDDNGNPSLDQDGNPTKKYTMAPTTMPRTFRTINDRVEAYWKKFPDGNKNNENNNNNFGDLPFHLFADKRSTNSGRHTKHDRKQVREAVRAMPNHKKRT